nr:MAG TPA: hypothetical protein [Caudoviricetes sp.]
MRLIDFIRRTFFIRSCQKVRSATDEQNFNDRRKKHGICKQDHS